MLMVVGNIYNGHAAYSTQKVLEHAQTNIREGNQEDYIKELQQKNPQIEIAAGRPDRNTKGIDHKRRTR